MFNSWLCIWHNVCNVVANHTVKPIFLFSFISSLQGELAHLCELCGKKFVRKVNLIRHRATHTDERPVKCPKCQKSFKTQHNLRHHMDIHVC